MGYNQLSFGRRVEILEKLRGLCVTVDGFAVYADGYTDRRVAEEMEGVTRANVAGVREEMFGKVRVSRGPDASDRAIAAIEKRMAEVEREVAQQLEALGKRVAAVESTVAMAVADIHENGELALR